MKLSVNNRDTEIESSSVVTISELIHRLELNQFQIAIEVNFELVPREAHDEFELHDGDQVEIVTLVGGG